MHGHRKRSRPLSWPRYLASVAAAAVLAATATVPARADNATDAASCIALVGGPTGTVIAALANGNGLQQLEQIVGDAKKATDAAGRYALKGCPAYGEDPVFLAITSALTALVIAGKIPNDYDQASKIIDNLIGEIVGKLLKTAIDDSASPLHYLADQLPADFKDKLEQYLKEQAVGQIADLLKSNPLTAQFLNYFDCGIVVATSGVKDQIEHLIDQAKQTKQDAYSCADFLKTCSDSAVDCLSGMAELGVAIAKGVAKLPGQLLKDAYAAVKEARDAAIAIAASPLAAGEWVHCHLTGATCGGDPGEMQYCSVQFQCNPGESNAACAARLQSQVAPNCTYFDYACTGGVQQVTLSNGNYCGCPAGQGFVVGEYYAACTPCSGPGKILDGAYCKTWSCTNRPGMKVSYGNSFGQCNYEHICQGAEVWDSKTNSCNHCPDNTVFAGYSTGQGANKSNNSGVCRACAYDETLQYKPGVGDGWAVSKQGSTSLDKLTCQKLQCEGLSHPDKKTPHECVPCREVFNPNGVKLSGALGKKFGNKPVCVDGVEDAAKDRCPANTVRYPDGSCRSAPKAQDPLAVHKRPDRQGPVERVSNPGDQFTSKGKDRKINVNPGAASSAPSLDGIGGGGGFSQGSTAPGAGKQIGGGSGGGFSGGAAGPGAGGFSTQYNRR